ncbi:hypothetical protein [Aquimarina algiphila]|uniref:hypothetical protein n=1 Tax=Aquimarina algiphila TaxID=2047982 RepID=UPI00232D5F01|nr:hypothetical protein [Aquimarina algiphila]
MKKYSLILLLFSILISCDKDDAEILSDNTKPQLFTPSIFDLNETSIENAVPIAINNFSSISDVSQGVVSRTWLLQEGSRYLLPTFERQDSLNLAPFIDPDLGLTNGNEVVHVLFQKEGETTVNLKNRFNKPVSFLGNDAVQKGNGLWELSTTIMYDVYANLNAEASVSNEDETEVFGILTASQNPSEDNTSGFTTVNIEAGSSLIFSDLTTIGRPDGRMWEFDGGTPQTGEEEKQLVTYNKLGNYTANITSIRNKRGNSLNAQEQTKTIPLIINVIPSTQPYIISGNAMSLNDDDGIAGTNIISFRVNGEIEPFTGAESNFTVNVKNVGFDQNFTVNSAKISSGDATVIELTLSQPILNSDTVTLSYNGDSITSIDSRTLTTFTGIPVDALNLNLFSNASNPSFENAVDNDRNVNSQGYNLFVGAGNNLDNARNADGSLFIDRSTEMSSDGNASLKFNAIMPFENGIGFLSLSNTILSNSAIPPGDYKLTFDVFIEDGSDFDAIFSVIQQGIPRTELAPFNAPGTGQWFTVERNFSNANTLDGNLIFNFRNQDNVGVVGRQVFYIDNLQIIDLEPR